MSIFDVRSSQFLLSIERALNRIATRGASPAAAAVATGVKVADVRAWLMEFNNGESQLTAERLIAVKQKVGVLSIRKVEPGDRPVPTGMLKPGREHPADPVPSPTEPAKTSVPIETAVAAARAGAVVSTPSARNEPDEPRPWQRKGWKLIRRAAVSWAKPLELIAAGVDRADPKIGDVVSGSGRSRSAWGMFMVEYFGSATGLTKETAVAFLKEGAQLRTAESPVAESVPVPPMPVKITREAVAAARKVAVEASLVEITVDDALIELGDLATAFCQARKDGRQTPILRRALLQAVEETASKIKSGGAS